MCTQLVRWLRVIYIHLTQIHWHWPLAYLCSDVVVLVEGYSLTIPSIVLSGISLEKLLYDVYNVNTIFRAIYMVLNDHHPVKQISSDYWIEHKNEKVFSSYSDRNEIRDIQFNICRYNSLSRRLGNNCPTYISDQENCKSLFRVFCELHCVMIAFS